MIIEKCDSNSVVVIFGSLRGDHIDGKKPHDFLNSLKNFPADKVFISDSANAWYKNGFDEYESFDESVNGLQELLLGYDSILFIGHSAGGYAAILYGCVLGVDTVVAFSPQTKIDNKWSGFKPHDCFYNNLKANELTDIHVVTCNNKNDKEHAAKMGEYNMVTVHQLKCSSHNSARHVVQQGNIMEYLVDLWEKE